MRLPATISAAVRSTNLKRNAVTLLLAAVTAGCGSSKPPVTVVPNPNAPTGLPTPSAPGPVNSYNGGQSPGAWTLTLDNTKNAFSYRALTYPPSPNQPATGNIQPSGGFSNLGPAGLAYEVLGRAAVLRPGNAATSPVFSVPQTLCYPITGKMRFQYIALYPGPQATLQSVSSPGPLGYGSIVASTDSTGKTWQFENLQGNVVAGPASFTGKCAVANSQAAIGLTGTSLLSNYWATTNGVGSNGPSTITSIPSHTESSIWVGPSGFFAADQSDPTEIPFAGASVAGIAEPSSPLSTSTLAAGQYLGFVYEAPITEPQLMTPTGPPPPPQPGLTAPVGFGQLVPGSGPTMTGGIFPNDNVTGTPNSDTQINLGKEDGTFNGLYPSVLITVLDPDQNCANFSVNFTGVSVPVPYTTAINAQGYATCTFPGVAVAGNPDGKYAIFVNTYNWAAIYGGQPMEFFLFQQ